MIVGCNSSINFTEQRPAEPPVNIGIYDSRAIAVAFVGSDIFKQYMTNLTNRQEKAKVEGNHKLSDKLEQEGVALQKRLHQQAFSTASVDNILAHVKSQILEIKKQTNVKDIVSKWDAQTVDVYHPMNQVDVTSLLIEAFKPNARQKKSAIEIQKHAPS